MSDETKIVMTIRGETATIGISRPDCDPLFFKTDGQLAMILGNVPRFLEEAEAKWKASPRYPKAALPAPTPMAAATARTVPVTAAKPQMPAMF